MSGAGGYFADGAGGESDDEDGAHDVCCAKTLCGVVEDLDEGETSRRFHYFRSITETETQCENQDESEGGVEDYGPCDGSWQRFRSVFNLFGCA